MIKAFIFDMDGLLIDSEPFWRKAEIEEFDKHGIKLTENDCRKTTGMRVDDVVKYWSEKKPEAQLNIASVVNGILKGVSDLVKKEGVPMSGVIEAIQFGTSKKLKMAVASASNYELIHLVLDKLNIRQNFEVIQSAENMEFGKPHPQVFIETAKQLGVKPAECLVFEDSIPGVIAAKAALMKVIAIPDAENFNKKAYCIADEKLESLTEFTPRIFNKLTAE